MGERLDKSAHAKTRSIVPRKRRPPRECAAQGANRWRECMHRCTALATALLSADPRRASRRSCVLGALARIQGSRNVNSFHSLPGPAAQP
ncbi:hypothetical protein MRX96_039105 [Rhipicephalus microplus]